MCEILKSRILFDYSRSKFHLLPLYFSRHSAKNCRCEYTNKVPSSLYIMRSEAVVAYWFIVMVSQLAFFVKLFYINFFIEIPQGGISLSPAFVIMFVMEHYNLDHEDALHLVQNRRYCISPNSGFLTQIKVRNCFLLFFPHSLIFKEK